MSKQQKGFGLSPLTAEQKALLEKQSVSADPAQRLKTNFYHHTRHLLLDDYFSAVKEAKEESDLIEARETFFSTLKKLREDYVKDLQLMQQLLFDNAGVFEGAHEELMIALK